VSFTASASARDLAGRVDADAMAAAVFEEILAECYPEFADDPGFVDSLERSVRDNIRTIVDMLAGRVELLAAGPADALSFADLSAELGIPVSTLERAYLLGAGTFWRQWFDRAREEPDAPLDELIREPTLLLFEYIYRVLGTVVRRYDQTRSDMVRTREHLRRNVLAQIFDGRASAEPPDELERALGYPVRATHVAVCLEVADRAVADAHAATLATAAGSADVLVHQRAAKRFTVWLARRNGWEERERAALRAALDAAGVRAVVSEPWPGVDGLRRTRDEVAMAAGVQHAQRADKVVAYRDVRLDALLLADPENAKRFLKEELGALAGSDPRLKLIREALLVWLQTGSHVAAAATLGVHENTVRNRVRQAEDLLPGGVTLQRRTELQVALRLQRVLG
jgi:hypothetical protein